MTSSDRSETRPGRPLCVDLDGTLIRTDLFAETLLRATFSAPLLLVRALGRILAGDRAGAKAMLAQATSPSIPLLPYCPEVLTYVEQARSEGRRTVLATAADRELATRVATHLGIFDEIQASENGVNLKGAEKARALVSRFGAGGYDYIGDARADLAVWKSAACRLVVSPSASLLALFSSRGFAPVVIGRRSPVWPAMLRACRVHQWIKNILVFVPIVANHSFSNPAHFLSAALMLIAFSLTASAVYLCNDLIDLDADRAHPIKRRRPFASGALPVTFGLAAVPALLLLAWALVIPLPASCGWLLAGYFAISFAYSFVLKSVVILDILTLASLYLFRIEAGGLATGVFPSAWLTAFAAAVFLNLGCLKRVAELRLYRAQGITPSNRRPYRLSHLPILQGACALAGLAAVATLALYPSSANAGSLYAHPLWLWALPVVFGAWLLRIYTRMIRNPKIDDPVLMAVSDPLSYIALVLLATSALLAA